MTRRLSPGFWLLLLGLAAVALFPYVWIVLTSFKARTDILTTPPVWIHAPNLIKYHNMIVGRGFDRYLLNSIEIGISSTLLALVVGTVAAYAVARFRVPAGNHLVFYILATRLGPPVAYALPMYFLFAKLGLL
ncbi:MAG: Binding-protein-dependent transport system inner rane component, partial [Gammaproteobacteria bacterium]|nr:Binding-protein-dependent transport system inner rane component [Gammaproteobacteria bacterium]